MDSNRGLRIVADPQNMQYVTKKEAFLNIMNRFVPWALLLQLISPFYYKNTRGRRPVNLEIILRAYFIQCWFSLSDVQTEESMYDSLAVQKFVGINPREHYPPDSTTLCKFRKILIENNLCERIFAIVNSDLESRGYIMRGGTIVDATIIEAPSSVKNKDKARDPEMHQTKKGNEWYFGAKLHCGVDMGSGLIHSLTMTPAHTSDISQTVYLIRRAEEGKEGDYIVAGDAGYVGIEKRPEIANDRELSRLEFRINKRPKSCKKDDYVERFIEYRKASNRSKVEHPFQIIKVFFGYKKLAYRGLEKNKNRLYVLCASANLIMCGRAGNLRPVIG